MESREPRDTSRPQARKGDHVLVHGHRQGEHARDGEIVDVRGEHGEPPYLVRWNDGSVSTLYPGSDVLVQRLGHDQ